LISKLQIVTSFGLNSLDLSMNMSLDMGVCLLIEVKEIT
jgi:hypothetical protein